MLTSHFTDPESYTGSFKRLIESMGFIINKSALYSTRQGSTLGNTQDRKFLFNLPMLIKPVHRPCQYIGISIVDAAAAVGGTPNQVGNILVENDECRLFLEVERNFISFIEVDLKRTTPFHQEQEFDPKPMLGALSINLSELDLARSKTHCHTHYDHGKNLKINVMCVYDGGPISVAFSSKYYGM